MVGDGVAVRRVDTFPDPATGLFLLQNIFGVWPAGGNVSPTLRRRLHDYAGKAIRESGRRTSWAQPDQDFEHSVHQWLDAVLDGPPATAITALLGHLLPHAHSDALGQKLLALTVPGVPDVYQGTELWEDSLVDPDNRRPVDYGWRRAALRRGPSETAGGGRGTGGPPGPAGDLHRRRLPTGPGHRSCRRSPDRIPPGHRRPGRRQPLDDPAGRERLGPTVLRLPPGTWTDRITGASHAGSVGASELFADLPVALLEKTDG